VKEAIKSSFVLFQLYESSEQAKKFSMFYKIERLPCIVAVCPLTGAKMASTKEGQFVDAAQALDFFLPFMDKPPPEEPQ